MGPVHQLSGLGGGVGGAGILALFPYFLFPEQGRGVTCPIHLPRLPGILPSVASLVMSFINSYLPEAAPLSGCSGGSGPL